MAAISVCMLAKNSARTLNASLTPLAGFSEVLLLDTGSTDETLSIARSFSNVIVHQTPFTQFGELRNKAANLAKHDWILALDSDEVLSPDLVIELSNLKLDPECAYEFEFKNFYNGKQILGCGWHPESHVRLYHRKAAQFSEVAVHEGLVGQSQIVRLAHPIHHTPYRSISDFLAKMQLYSDLFTLQYQGKRRSSFATALGHGVGAFCKSYLLKRGIFLGKEGFIISSYNAITAFYKYLKLAEANRSL